ncbi:MAG: 2-oxo acid dehydrogenase subunit E2 [Parahaliea sp.]
MSVIQAITVPKWGLTMTEGTLTEWLIQEGDTVAVGDVVADMETSKIVNTVEANVAGVFRRKVAKPGDTLEIAALLGVVAAPDTSEADIDAFVAAYIPEGVAQTDLLGSKKDAREAEAAAPLDMADNMELTATTARDLPATAVGHNEALAALGKGGSDEHLHASVHARRLAREHRVNLNNITGTGRNNRISRADVLAALAAVGVPLPSPSLRAVDVSGAAQTAGHNLDDSHVRATALARRLAGKLGINLHDCRQSGARGRVCKADVEAAQALRRHKHMQSPVQKSSSDTDSQAPDQTPVFEEQPMSGMRRTIATRLQASKQNAPHFRLSMDCEIDKLLAVRKQINDNHPGLKISVNDFLVKAVATALIDSPDVNIQFDGQTIRRFSRADVAVAVALDNGLITPIVKAADKKSLSEISGAIRELATRARTGTLAADDFMGGTFTLSNLGMYGISRFDAIINAPQAGILAVGAGQQQAVVRNGEVVIATLITLCASFDHRVIDGAVGAQFMDRLKRLLETPALMLA